MNILDSIPYWLVHAFVALAIMAATGLLLSNIPAGAAAGIAFYAGREIRDREKLGRWDWPGLIAPVVACVIAWYFIR